jgi:hypothetical protein
VAKVPSQVELATTSLDVRGRQARGVIAAMLVVLVSRVA